LNVETLAARAPVTVVHGDLDFVLTGILQGGLPFEFAACRVDAHAPRPFFEGVGEGAVPVSIGRSDDIEK
jgi:hypothetical protein